LKLALGKLGRGVNLTKRFFGLSKWSGTKLKTQNVSAIIGKLRPGNQRGRDQKAQTQWKESSLRGAQGFVIGG